MQKRQLLLLVLLFVFTVCMPFSAQAQNLLGMHVLASADTIPSGATISYLIQIRNSSIISDAVNAKLQIQLPPETASASVEGNIYVQSFNFNSTTDILTILLVSPFRAGISTEVNVTAQVNHTADLENFTFDVTFNFDADNADGIESVIPLTIRPPGLAFSIQKYGSRSVHLNANYIFNFRVFGTGGQFEEIQSITLVDTLADGVELVNKPSNLAWDPATRILTMDRPKSSPSVNFSITVRFPDSYFQADQRVYNTAHLVVKFTDGTEWKYKSTWYVDLVYPISIDPPITLNKRGPQSNIMSGTTGVKWNINVTNTGDQPSYQIVLSDTLPDACKPSLLFVTGLSGINATLYYQTYDQPGTWRSLGKNYYGDRMWYNSSNLQSVFKVKIVKLVIESLPANRGVNFEIEFTASGTDRDGAPLQLPLVVNNCATLDHHWPDGTVHTIRSCSWFNLTPIALKPFVSISTSSSTINAGDIFTYTINLTEKTKIYTRLMTPVTAILLPEQVEYQSWKKDSFLWGYNRVPTPQVDIIDNYNGTGRTLVRFDWRPTGWGWLMMVAYRNIRMTVTVKAKRNLIPQTFPAHYYLLYIGNTEHVIESTQGVADQYDLNDDGSINDIVYRSSPVNVTIRSIVGLQAEEFVKGTLDPTWTKYPDYADTYAGGIAEYKIVLTNTGSVPMGNFKMMTILPYVGDVSVIGSQPRESAWRPILTDEVTIEPNVEGNIHDAGVQVYYSLSGNPQRSEFDPTGPPGAEPPNWSTGFAGSGTKSIYFDLGTLVLYGGESVAFTWSMSVPEDAPKGTIAWNSFAYRGQRMDNNSTLLPAEAHKVGVANLWSRLSKTDNQETISTSGGFSYYIDYAYNELTPAADAYLLDYIPDCMNVFSFRVNGSIRSHTEIEPGVYKLNLGRLEPGDVGQVRVHVGLTCFQQVYENCVVLYNGDVAITEACDETNAIPVIIGDTVWYDTNEDGVQDSGETGIANAVVNLYTYSGSGTNLQKYFRQSTTTDENGTYQFMDFPNNYLVEVDPNSLPAGYTVTSSQLYYTYSSSYLNSNRLITTADFGYVATLGSIGDRVWYDLDGDGNQGAGENGIPGVILELHTPDGTVVATDTTDAGGMYLFANIAPGEYNVIVVESSVPAHHTQSGGSVPHAVTLDRREVYLDADFGYHPDPGNIGDYVWLDWDGEGDQDPDETGIADVIVYLIDSIGDTVARDTTDTYGRYLFASIDPGSYAVNINSATLPTNHHLSGGKVPHEVTLNAGESYLDADFGYEPDPGEIGDYVWHDANGDFVQDANEKGINGARLYLVNTAGDTVATQTTGTNGLYRFMEVRPGRYRIYQDQETIPPTYSATGGSNPISVSLHPAEVYLDADFGYRAIGIIGDYVWLDLNQDGMQDPEERGIPGMVLRLYDDSGKQIAKTRTNELGNYYFRNIPVGNFYVEIDESTLPPGLRLTTVNRRFEVRMNEADRLLHVDFGYASASHAPGSGCGQTVFAWYEPWYASEWADSSLRHWATDKMGGIADTARFDLYYRAHPDSLNPEQLFDSHAAMMWEHDILLAWAADIDVFVVDWFGASSYENYALRGLLDTAERLYQQYGDRGFDFRIAVNYNDKARGLLTDNLQYLADSVLVHPAYLNGREKLILADNAMFRRPVFVQNLHQILNAETFKLARDLILPDDVLTVWNWDEKDLLLPGVVDGVYPWIDVQPNSWDDDKGLEWGDEYLERFYTGFNGLGISLMVGSVWPGYDERQWVHGQNHWMSRQDSMVYDWTWEKAHDYRPNWVLIESWNDFNRGSHVMNSVQYRDHFIKKTRNEAVIWKGGKPCARQIPDLGLQVPETVLGAHWRGVDSGLIESALHLFFCGDYAKALGLLRPATIEPNPQPGPGLKSGNQLVFISGTPAHPDEDWSNAVDGDLEGWDGTATVKPADGDPTKPAWAIFGFADGGLYEFTYVTFQTDNGTDDDRYEERQAARFEVQISEAGLDPSHFTSIGSWRVKHREMTWYALNHKVRAKYVKLLIHEPGWGQGGWRQVVEFGVNNKDRQGAIPVSEELIYIESPTEYRLDQNYPNPFNLETKIVYTLPNPSPVKLAVYDAMGREVAVLIDEEQGAGEHRVIFYMDKQPSGIYFLRLQAGTFVQVRKIVLMK